MLWEGQSAYTSHLMEIFISYMIALNLVDHMLELFLVPNQKKKGKPKGGTLSPKVGTGNGNGDDNI